MDDHGSLTAAVLVDPDAPMQIIAFYETATGMFSVGWVNDGLVTVTVRSKTALEEWV